MQYTIRQFRAQYGTDDKCLDSLLEIRYGKRGTCPKCKKETNWSRVSSRMSYQCQWGGCGYQIFPMVGTVFEGSHMALSDWFYILYLMTITRHGVSAKEVQRQLGCSYVTAHRNCHLIRTLLGMPSVPRGKMSGKIQADDHYSGGRRKGVRGRGAAGKTKIMGMIADSGEARAFVVPDMKRKTLMPIIEQNVETGSHITTDEFASYNAVGMQYEHGVVHHARKEFVNEKGDTTNSIENYWGIFKKSVKSTHVHISSKHTQKYLDEFSFRYTHRKTPGLMFSLALANLLPS